MELLVNSNLLLMAFFVNILVHAIQQIYSALSLDKEFKPWVSRIMVMIIAFGVGGANAEYGTAFSDAVLTDCVAILVASVALYHFGYLRILKLLSDKIGKKLI